MQALHARIATGKQGCDAKMTCKKRLHASVPAFCVKVPAELPSCAAGYPKCLGNAMLGMCAWLLSSILLFVSHVHCKTFRDGEFVATARKSQFHQV